MHPETSGCIKALGGIAGIVVLESVAMLTGHNGTVLRLSIAAVAGLGGFAVGALWRARRNAKKEASLVD
jgi:hypothetical protein